MTQPIAGSDEVAVIAGVRPAGGVGPSTAGGDSAPSAARERTVWADAAKGACIILVVLWHVTTKHYLRIEWRIPVPIPGFWGVLGEQLLPLRMPLFFTISGMFAVGAVGRPWRVLARSRIAKFAYLYVLWLLIHTAVLANFPEFDTTRAGNLLDLVEELTITPTNLWYLSALALYFTVAKAARRIPRAVVLTAALALSTAASAGLFPTPGNRAGLLQNLLFFLLGCYFQPAVRNLAAAANWRRLAGFGAAYADCLATVAVAGTRTWPGLWPVTSAAATLFGVTAASYACRWTTFATALATIGRHTLPVYVMHMPVLAVIHRLLVGHLSRLDTQWQILVAIVEPVLLVALVVWICLVLDRGLRGTGASWLFDLPRAAGAPRRIVEPAAATGSAA
jgi:uncharacterized membrane protein YcfT